MKKKGFTLVELISIIAVVAVIAIIAVPIVLNVIEKAKEGSAVDSAYEYIHAIEQGVTVREIKDKVVVSNGEYTDLREFENENNITLKGSKPSTGTFTLEKRRVISAELIINGYRVICDKKTCRTSGKADEITITYDTDGGTLSKNSDEIYKGDTLTLPVPEKANYSFIGWYTESNGSGDKITNSTPITNNINVYAYYIQTVTEFEYTGNEQTFTAPCDGKYKLEVWGTRWYNK